LNKDTYANRTRKTGGVEKKAHADIILSTIKDGSEQSNVVWEKKATSNVKSALLDQRNFNNNGCNTTENIEQYRLFYLLRIVLNVVLT